VKCSRMFLLAASSRHMASHLDISSHRTVSMLSAAQVKTTATPGTSSEPPPSPDSRSSCDGWRPKPRHDRRPRVPAHRLRAYQPAHPVKLSKMARKRAQQRWSGLLRCVAKQLRATLGDDLWADSVAHANACYKDAFVSAFREPILRCMGPRTAVRRRDMRESVHDALRAAPGSRAGCGCDVRHVGAGAPLPRAPAT